MGEAWNECLLPQKSVTLTCAEEEVVVMTDDFKFTGQILDDLL